MNFDFEEMGRAMARTIREATGDDVPGIEEAARKIVEQEKEVLAELIRLRAQGILTDRELRSELGDEAINIAGPLLFLKETSTVLFQDAVNAALEFLQDYILKSVRVVL